MHIEIQCPMRTIVITVCTLWLVIFSNAAQAQARDTIISFQEAKARLMRVNLGLLAAYYDIDIARAGVVQARLWNNPYFIFNGELYSMETNEYFHFRNQHLLQVEQTFSIAGKGLLHLQQVLIAKEC